jgi:serine/threonine protein kinase
MGSQGENMSYFANRLAFFEHMKACLYDVIPHDSLTKQVVNKDTLKKPRHKAKLESEIKIHMKLKHPHVVYLHDAFEDKENVYLLMELCEAQTLLELVKRKKRLADCVRRSSPSCRRTHDLIDFSRMCAALCTSY